MGPWAAAGARTRAKTAARIARAIGPDFRVVHRLRRERNSPTPTAAIAPTMTAMSGRFSGGDGVMSGPLRVAPTGDPPLGIRVTDHPNAARSSGFVIANVTVSRALPEFVTRRV